MSKISSGWHNPEFQRNLWLELSPLMPGLIALLLFVAVAVSKEYESLEEACAGVFRGHLGQSAHVRADSLVSYPHFFITPSSRNSSAR